ncbi:acetyltransferase (GNAT) family protein [Kribbella amoyensis]|uniref:Acetyltransferase (GNAT) family protein n=1 Tax=Kribbella amoyensis TaxID=996641 RepID=A0A561BYM8_9ACTN|nr:GNAT family N-acetyltransferase [Kribbella amoyensis]TWD83977.1 acetyltransferase (GNAT) family protein [Kribbella amoyensis]
MAITITPLTDPDYRAFSRRLAWLAADADGNPVGSAYLRLNSKPSQAHLTELELTVHPAERRKGVGSLLLDAATTAAWENEARIVLADAVAESPGDHFLARHGFTVGLTLVFTRLPLRDTDVPSVAPPTGYELVAWQGAPPDNLIESFTVTRAAMNDAPIGDISYGVEAWDVERSRFVAEVVAQRGDRLHTVAAIHQESGDVVAFTELVVPGDGQADAQHYGTAVRTEHRGHGLARWVKAEQIRQVRADYPELRGLLTDMAESNHAMRAVNDALGYQITHRTHRYRLDRPGQPVSEPRPGASPWTARAR